MVCFLHVLLLLSFQARKISTSGQNKKGLSPWYDVAMTTSTSIVVSHFYLPNENGEDVSTENHCCAQCCAIGVGLSRPAIHCISASIFFY